MSGGRATPQPAIVDSAIQEMRAGFRGPLLRPGEDGFDTARRVWNGMIDRWPALIARCTGVADVRSALQFGREHGLRVAVRGGGHNVAGKAVCDGGIVIDLSLMKGIRVDPERRTAWAQAGLTWGDFDHEAASFGLATTGGHVSTTGIAGLTLGGGIGWLMRKHGLTCDNLLSAEVVTADGRHLTASARENADLFWGLRGGGGNFGIATSFEYRLHPVDTVLGGMVLYPAAQAKEVLQFYREFVTTVPDELTSLAGFLTAPPAPFIPEQYQGRPMVGVVLCYAGPIPEGERAVQPLRAFGPPAVDLIHPAPYRGIQTMFDAAFPLGLLNYWKSGYLDRLSDGAIDTLARHAAEAPSPQSVIAAMHLGGAVSRVNEDETPVNLRKVTFALNMMATWTDPAASEPNVEWTRRLAAAMEPFSTGNVFVSFLGDEGADRVQAAYTPATYQRLVKLKNKYDPTNLFQLNQNIKPTG